MKSFVHQPASVPTEPSRAGSPARGIFELARQYAATIWHPHTLRERSVRKLLVALQRGQSACISPFQIVAPLSATAQRELEGSELFRRTLQALTSSSQAPLLVVEQHTPRLDVDLGDWPVPFRLVAGVHLLYACRKLGRSVHVRLLRDDRVDDLLRQLCERNPRCGIAAIEWGHLFRRALARRLFPSQAALAKRIGWTRSTVQRAVKLASLPDSILRAFDAAQLLGWHDAEILNQATTCDYHAVRVEAATFARQSPRADRREVLERMRRIAGRAPSSPAVTAKAVSAANRDPSLKHSSGPLAAISARARPESASRPSDVDEGASKGGRQDGTPASWPAAAL
ncbi:hypothetical protein [Azohydromonas sediminis]|uniref:hypothetical protein n=1 Tax=Azohydromonas sediminis TaxID=2259674 RepID=UPI0013C2A227|nr:hypothetical protein [Azohydromonas sediminis]